MTVSVIVSMLALIGMYLFPMLQEISHISATREQYRQEAEEEAHILAASIDIVVRNGVP